MKFGKFKLSTFMLIVMLVASLLVRLYRISATQTFLEDEGRDMLIVKRMVDTKRPALLGPQTSIGSMYLGPFYYYFITPAAVLADMDPVGPAVMIALTGVLTVALLFMLTRSWLGIKAAWVAAILYAFMPLPVSFTRNSWNPDLTPLAALLVIWVMDKLRVQNRDSLKWFGLLGVLTGILVQLHYMVLVFVALYGLTVLWWWRKNIPGLLIGLGLGLLGLTLALAPFLIFEVRNDWVNTQAIFRFISVQDAPNIRYQLPFSLWWSKVAGVTTSVFGGLFSRGGYRPLDAYTPLITLATALMTFAGITLSPLAKSLKALLIITIFGSLAVLGIYQENIHVHYLGFLFAIVYIGFASVIANRNRFISAVGIIGTAVLLIYSLPVTWGNIRSGSSLQSVKAREVAAYIAARSGGLPYNIVSSSSTSSSPFQYFAFLNPHPPTNEWTGRVYLICQDAPCRDSDIYNDQLFLSGPAHPSLANYTGHPMANALEARIELLSNDHVSNGIWVAELRLTKK